MRHLIISLIATIFLAAPGYGATYDVDPTHTTLGFSVRHMVVSNVQGGFDKFTGEFDMNDKGELVKFSAKVEVASVNTRLEKRDNHLRSSDFFDVEKFPEMTFVSTKVTANGNNYTAEGDLTIKDVTKPVTLTGELLGMVKDPMGDHRVGFQAEGNINRQDFNVSFNQLLETGGLIVGDEVKIILNVEGIKRKE